MKHYIVLIFSLLILLNIPSMTHAHAFLDNATPKVGAIVNVAPKEIRIQFTQPIEVAFSHLSLFKDDGQKIDLSDATIDASDQTQLRAIVKGTLLPGSYEVRWDVLSVDTHKTNGHFPFTYQP